MWWAPKAEAFDAVAQQLRGHAEQRDADGVLLNPRWKACGKPRLSKHDTVAKFSNGLVLERDGSRVKVIERPEEE